MGTACDVLVKLLSDVNVKHIFGVPGDAINSLTEAIRLQDKIKFIHVNHEETGSFAASAQAKLTGNLAVCCGTAGPGAIHLLNGLYDAKTDHAPVLAITGQVESRFLGSNYHQEVDLHNLFSDVAVYNQVVNNVDQLAYMTMRAITSALRYRGVAHLNIPVDIANQKVSNSKKWKFSKSWIHQPVLLEDDELINEAATLLNQNDKIVIFSGIGCANAVAELFELADILAAPIVHALKGKELFLEDHPLSIGGIGHLGGKPAVQAFEDCDLIMLIGTDFPYFDFLPKGKKAIQIDIDNSKIGKRMPVDIGLCGDAKAILQKLFNMVKRKQERSFLKSLQKHKRQWQENIAKEINNRSTPIKPQRLAYLVGEKADENAVIISDTGLVTAWNARYLKIKKGQRYILSGGLATMAYGIGASIGAKLIFPERQVICVIGDGGFSMLMGDFIIAVKYKLKIIFVIYNNSKLGLIMAEQEAKAGVPNYQTDMLNPDFAEYAKLCGGDGITVNEESQLRMALDKAFSSNLPFVLNVMIDPKELPLPPKITLNEIYNYSVAKIKENLS